MKNPLIVIKTEAAKAGHALGQVLGKVDKVDALYHALTPEAKAAALKTFADVLRFVVAVKAAQDAGGTNFVLDEAVVSIARELYTDAELDIQTAQAVFQAFDIQLPAAMPAKKAA